jgi:hypothetical protein
MRLVSQQAMDFAGVRGLEVAAWITWLGCTCFSPMSSFRGSPCFVAMTSKRGLTGLVVHGQIESAGCRLRGGEDVG